jgi:SAM-dependent methyltransferase
MSTPEIDPVKKSMRSAWMAGDFGVIARTMTAEAEAFVAGLQFAPGSRVLDVACGTGNTALPLARLGLHVTGLDIAPNLLVQARERAAAERLGITFDEGDAEQLPYADASFDAALSMFGAMFAPRPEFVASEFARVLKPGGRLAMANWTPASFTAQSFRVSSGFGPQSPFPPPVAWGDEATVRARLLPHFDNITTRSIPIQFNLPYDPVGTVAFFRRHFGPTAIAFSRLDEASQARMQIEMEVLWTQANVAPVPSIQTIVNNEYLEVRATRRT